jgi:hypothetical protein
MSKTRLLREACLKVLIMDKFQFDREIRELTYLGRQEQIAGINTSNLYSQSDDLVVSHFVARIPVPF